MPLTLRLLKSIRRLLRAGERHAAIARRFDLATGTIARIASERKLRRRKLHLLTESDLPEDDQPPDYLAANLRRCPGCGGMVYQWPCLVCRLREAPPLRRDRETEGRRERQGFPSRVLSTQYSVLSTDSSDARRPTTDY